MSDLLKRDNESQIEYVKRIVYGKLVDKTIDDDYTILAPLVFGKDYSSDVARRMFYGARDILKLIDFNKINNLEDNDIIKQIEDKTLELEKMKIKYQDQKREYKALLRTDARFEHLKNMIFDEVSKNKYIPFEKQYKGNTYNNHMVVSLSDWHLGLEEENYWNKVDTEIIKFRTFELQNKVIQLIHRHNIDTIHIEILGDIINGLIHVTTRISNEEDVISQVKIASEILSNFIYNISKEVNNIKVYSSTSNHGRCVANIKESLDTENFELLIPWYLKAKLSDINNIEMINNSIDSGIIYYSFLNEVIFASHGHQEKVATVMNDLSQMLKIFPTEIHLGHYHAYYERDEYDVSVLINGCMSGTDKYAKSIRKTNKPSQNIMIYNEEGRECTYKVKFSK